jgi:hypothetical protein
VYTDYFNQKVTERKMPDDIKEQFLNILEKNIGIIIKYQGLMRKLSKTEKT